MSKIFFSFIFYCFCCLLFCSCRGTKTDVNGIVSKFSDLECRAFSLREQRYALADKIRFTEDSILKIKDESGVKTELQNNLSGYLKEKESILTRSLQLADTIKLQLDTIIKVKLQSKDKINEFNKALSLELDKRKCQ